MLELKNITKYFGKLRALDGLNMKIGKGELFGFIGPNGAGKTTTMKIISGILSSDSGEIYYNGNDVKNNQKFLKEKIGYMPDFFGVYDNLTVVEYMEFFSSLYNIDKKEASKRNEELLELVHLSDKKKELVDGLSRGMKQRLCLARAMVHKPEILILDEPASGMEPAARADMKNILKQLYENGNTIVISSHILSEVSELCNTIGIIIRGEMVIQGDKRNVILKQKSMQPVIIKIIEGADMAVKILKAHPLVSNIAKDTGGLAKSHISSISFQFLGEEEDESELLNRLIYADIKILSFKREDSDLESIFLELTKTY